MPISTTIPLLHERASTGLASAWPTHGQVMIFRSVASRKRAAAARLQAHAELLLTEAAECERRADNLVGMADPT